MQKLLFLLGSQPELAAREVCEVLGVAPDSGSSRILDGSVLVLNASTFLPSNDVQESGLPSQKNLDWLNSLQQRLGGTRKIIWPIAGAKRETLDQALVEVAHMACSEQVRTIAVSLVGVAGVATKLRSAIMASFAAEGRALRYIDAQQGSEISTAQTYGNRLALATSREGVAQRGREFVVTQDGEGGLFIGVTATVQDIAAYSHRDRELPEVDAYNGLLPVKLAQIMVNLALGTATWDEVLLVDPCCGNGRILLEASRAGFATLGSDISEEQVAHTAKNLEWWKRVTGESIVAEVRDATAPETVAWAKQQAGEKAVVVCTEPWLGKPARQRFVPTHTQKWLQDVSGLYKKMLSAWMSEGAAGSMLMVIPAPVQQDGRLFTELLTQVQQQAGRMELHLEVMGEYRRSDTYIARLMVLITR